jgi:hypothetical protein
MTPAPPLMLLPAPPGGVIVMPLLFPRSKLSVAVGDPVNVTSRNDAHEAVEPPAAAIVAVFPIKDDSIRICETELPDHVNAPDMVFVTALGS